MTVHVPAWVREQRDAIDVPKLAAEDYTRHIDAVIASPLAARVWAGLEKYELRERKRSRNRSKVSCLAVAISSPLDWFHGDMLLTGGEKKEIGRKLKRSATEFAVQWRALRACSKRGLVPGEFSPNLFTLAKQVALDRKRMSDSNDERFKSVPPELEEEILVLGIFNAYKQADSLMEAVAKSVDEWLQAPVMLAKPNDPNAHRLYFLRRVTASFIKDYGRPLRAETLALASVFFDCSDIEEADLSRLAPVPKSRKPESHTAT